MRSSFKMSIFPEMQEDLEENMFKYIQDPKNRLEHLAVIMGPYLDGVDGTKARWYEFVEDMKVLTKEFSSWLFVIEREGEEPMDLEKAYFENGMHYSDYATIHFPMFKRENLKC